MSRYRAEFSIAYNYIKNDVYVFGGIYDNNNIPDTFEFCEKYSVKQNKWSAIQSMPSKRAGASACIFDNKYIYVIGGYFKYIEQSKAVGFGLLARRKPARTNAQNFLNHIEKYDIENDSW